LSLHDDRRDEQGGREKGGNAGKGFHVAQQSRAFSAEWP
jgi:hypothetical protein